MNEVERRTPFGSSIWMPVSTMMPSTTGEHRFVDLGGGAPAPTWGISSTTARRRRTRCPPTGWCPGSAAPHPRRRAPCWPPAPGSMSGGSHGFRWVKGGPDLLRGSDRPGGGGSVNQLFPFRCSVPKLRGNFDEFLPQVNKNLRSIFGVSFFAEICCAIVYCLNGRCSLLDWGGWMPPSHHPSQRTLSPPAPGPPQAARTGRLAGGPGRPPARRCTLT